MSRLTRHCWHNGAVVENDVASPSIASISFHMGTGVFDGMMAYWNKDHYQLFQAEAHFERLRAGAGRMGMPIAWSTNDLIAGVRALLASEPRQTYYIRPIVFRGGPELWLTGAEGRPVDVSIFGVPTERGIREPIACELSPVERVSSRAMPVSWKVCGIYVNSYLVRRSAEQCGAKDGIMLDRCGRIAEASAANVFFIDRSGLVTPPLNDDVFPGITRRVVFDLCEKIGLPCVERNLYPADLVEMRGGFICSTLMEMRPISRIGSHIYRSAERAEFRAVDEAFSALTGH